MRTRTRLLYVACYSFIFFFVLLSSTSHVTNLLTYLWTLLPQLCYLGSLHRCTDSPIAASHRSKVLLTVILFIVNDVGLVHMV
jgi:hypothetical protein